MFPEMHRWRDVVSHHIGRQLWHFHADRVHVDTQNPCRLLSRPSRKTTLMDVINSFAQFPL